MPEKGEPTEKTDPGRRIYTRRGDDGSTGLLFGGRVGKDHPRVEACGAIDEAVAALGLARALGPEAAGLADLLLSLQRQLFVAGAELATSRDNQHKLRAGNSKVTEEMVSRLEDEIDRMVKVCPLPDFFVVPGETQIGGALDLARAIGRRAERRAAVLLRANELSDDCVLRFLNRLSDLLFVAARLEESARNMPVRPSVIRPEGAGDG